MGAVTLYALSQRSEVREQALRAHVQELQAQSDAQLARDPELSILLALEAVGLAATDSSTEALRNALIESRAQRLVIVGEALLVAKAHGRDVLAVTADGDVVTAPGGSTGAPQRFSTEVNASDASFAEDGTALLTGRDGEARLVTRDGSVRAIPGVNDAKGAALSPDGSLAAIIDDAGVRLVEVESGLVLESYSAPRGNVCGDLSG